jgi:hypothetical protein
MPAVAQKLLCINVKIIMVQIKLTGVTMTKKIAKTELPQADSKLHTLANSVDVYAGPRIMGAGGQQPIWPDIPVEFWMAFTAALDVWKVAYAACDVPHLPTVTEAKNAAKANLKDALNMLIEHGLCSYPRTKEDVLAMGFALRDPNRTPHPMPEIKPDLEAVPSGSARHTVTAINPLTHLAKRPPLVKGVVFAFKLRLPNEPKAEAADMPSVFQAETTKNFQWKESDIGKVADYAVAYETEGYVRGTWSNVGTLTVA